MQRLYHVDNRQTRYNPLFFSGNSNLAEKKNSPLRLLFCVYKAEYPLKSSIANQFYRSWSAFSDFICYNIDDIECDIENVNEKELKL